MQRMFNIEFKKAQTLKRKLFDDRVQELHFTVPKGDPRTITMEKECSPNATIFIENIYWQINVKTYKHNKVKLETTIIAPANSTIPDAQYFSEMKLSIKGTENQVVIKSDDINKPYKVARGFPVKKVSGGNTFVYFDSTGRVFSAAQANPRRILTIYIPFGANLEIESKYSDVIVENNIKYLNAQINNGSLNMKDADKVVLRTAYSNLNTGDIRNADIDISNGKMAGGNYDQLAIHSKSSTIEFHSSADINMHSVSDQYEIDEVTSLSGAKNYGSIRISNVKAAFDLSGASSDIKIRHIDPTATNINIQSQFADIRLPVSNLENYSVEYEGVSSSIYAPFKKDASGSPGSSKFKTLVGDSTKKNTAFLLKCTSCTVDFR
jgi:hypothetical protein